MAKVTIIKNGEKVVIDTENGDQTFLEICRENDIEMESACGGNGVCTTCLINVNVGKENISSYTDQEEFMLANADDLSMRLGCQCKPEGDCEFELAY